MSKPIKTYDDLQKERQRLEVLLQSQKEILRNDIAGLKQELQPAVRAFSFLGKIFTREKGNLLLTGGMNRLVDLVFKKLILSRTGWITRLVVPFLIKNYSSHIVAEHKTEWIKKLFSLFGRKHHHNGQAATDVS
jgi:hypothetical protein